MSFDLKNQRGTALPHLADNTAAGLLWEVYADMANDESEAWPSASYLADELGWDVRRVKRARSLLVERGFLIDTGQRRGRTRQVIVYLVSATPREGWDTWPAKGVTRDTGKGVTRDTGKGVTRDTRNHQRKHHANPSRPSAAGVCEPQPASVVRPDGSMDIDAMMARLGRGTPAGYATETHTCEVCGQTIHAGSKLHTECQYA